MCIFMNHTQTEHRGFILFHNYQFLNVCIGCNKNNYYSVEVKDYC